VPALTNESSIVLSVAFRAQDKPASGPTHAMDPNIKQVFIDVHKWVRCAVLCSGMRAGGAPGWRRRGRHSSAVKTCKHMLACIAVR